ncbi:hypothetical protein F2Q69_00029031 [Brassica cretica]|uniref:Uncharacterized protein n=1 Tax=Brassica cretica TaxID=69181 RepID=A0A8S9RY47_BRACR|nr:hypothetical protein F2Q69_00029031 [Brassica cretica]
MVSGKGETMLVAQDHDADEMLKAGGIQLAYRYLETNAQMVLRKSPVLLFGAPRSTRRWFMTGNDSSLGRVIAPYLAIQYASPPAGSIE